MPFTLPGSSNAPANARAGFVVVGDGAGAGNAREGGFPYAQRFEFPNDLAAGFASPYTEGLGRLVRSADTNNQASMDAGDFRLSNATNVNYADFGYYVANNDGTGITRVSGYTAIFKLIGSDVTKLGFTTNVVMANSTQFAILANSAGTLSYSRAGTDIVIGAFSALSTYLIAVTLRATGLEIRIKGGAYSEWSVLFVETNWSTTPVYPSLSGAGAMASRMSFIRTVNAADAGKLATGSPVLSVSNPDTTILTGKAETLICLQGTPPVGAPGNLYEVRYRQADASNYMLARIQWNGANYELVTGRVIAGAETLQGSPIASVAFASNVERLWVRATVNSHDFWTTPSTTITKRYGTITDSTGVANAGVSVRNVGFTSTSILVWDYVDADIASLLDRAAA